MGLLGLASLLVACDQRPSAPPEPEPPPQRQAPREVRQDVLAAHVEFLASDALGGRSPGTDGDEQAQRYIEDAFRAAGFEPGFGIDYRQTFEVIDGVRLVDSGASGLETAAGSVPHSLVPFSESTGSGGVVEAELIFVGYGITEQGGGAGDYAGISRAVSGKIVVALAGGPDDPHLPPGATRPQNKLIAARDRGAVGFVLWDPATSTPFPNHGRAVELGIPAVFVGADGNLTLQQAFGIRKATEAFDANAPTISKGKTSRKPASLRADVEPIVLTTANVGALLVGNSTTSRTVVVGAHHDHLGMGTASSLAPGEVAVHNGADDNASGVAGVLELCAAMAELPMTQRPYDVLCLTFGAEEMGLLGSKYFIEQLDQSRRESIVAMINFDMIGRAQNDELIIAGVGTAPVWDSLIKATETSLTVKTKAGGYGPSDHGSFYEADIPVLHFFTGPHADYHKPSDDVSKLDFAAMTKVTELALGIVDDIVHDGPAFEFHKTKSKEAGGRRAFKVSLGTIPDYAAEVDGLRLSGVREGGPAQAAGMQKGDVIKQLGSREIHGIDDYMAAFGELKPGEEIPVVVERAGELVELKLTPAAPRPR